MIRQFSATCGVVMCTRCSPKQALDLAHFEVWEQVENNMLPIPFDHSLYLVKIVQLSYRQFCLPKFAHVELSLAQEVHRK